MERDAGDILENDAAGVLANDAGGVLERDILKSGGVRGSERDASGSLERDAVGVLENAAASGFERGVLGNEAGGVLDFSRGTDFLPHHPRDQLGFAARRPARLDDRCAYPLAPLDRRFDLGRLDAVATDLHLAVAPAEELDPSVRKDASDVAGPVEPLSMGERIGNEPLGGEVGPPQITAGENVPSKDDLPGDADRSELARAVQDEGARVRDWPADRGKLRPLARIPLEPLGRHDVGLGRPVLVVEDRAVETTEEASDLLGHPELFAGGYDLAESQLYSRLRRRLGEPLESDERKEDPLDALACENESERVWIATLRIRNEDEGPPLCEGREDLFERGVERKRCVLQRSPTRPRRRTRALPGDEFDEGALGHRNALRSSRRARREDDVGEIVLRDLDARPG